MALRSLILAPLLTALTAYGGVPPCPADLTEWRDWHSSLVRRLGVGGFQSKAPLEEAEALFEKCGASLNRFPQALTCTERLRRFSRAVLRSEKPGHSLGLTLSDREYYAKVPYPELLELPPELKTQEFLKWLDEDELDQAAEVIRTRNRDIKDPDLKWETFVYRSQHLPAPDGKKAFGRFFILVPGEAYDRYFQFGLRDSPEKKLPNGLSVVAVQKTDPESGLPLPKPKVYLKDFWRKRDGNTVEVSTRLKERGKLENCYECHKSPVLPITPDPAFFHKEKFADAVARVNERMSAYGEMEYVGLDMEDFGPGMGPRTTSLQTDDFFLRMCSNGRVWDQDEMAELRRAMNCTRCHDGSYKGVLNYPSGLRGMPGGGTSLVHRYIINHEKMPPNAKLSREHRESLVNCLLSEYYVGFAGKPGILESWLAQDGCWPSP